MVSPNGPRIVPEVTELTRPYWEGAARGALMLQRCCACGVFRHPPSAMCTCGAWDSEWVAAAGTGTIYTYTTVVHPVHVAVEARVPYNVVLVELDEGPRVVSTVVDDPVGRLTIGQRVGAVFETLEAGIGLVKFRVIDAPR
jgi:uncharacterized OB-fold protein